jgi:hypothetical protein
MNTIEMWDTISLNKYITLLGEMGYKLKNVKNPYIPLAKRKKAIYELIIEKIDELDELDDKKDDFKNKFEELFKPKVKAKKVKNDLKVEKDLSRFNIGEIVLVETKHKVNDIEYDIYVKCKIYKINKCSITLQKYKCNVDFNEYHKNYREQTFGKLYFNWTDELEQSKQNFINVKDIDKIMKTDWDLYDTYVKQTYYSIDFGNL